MKKRAAMKCLLSASIAGILASFSINASAAGFALYEYNGVNSENFGAGAAASATDASTAYSNPAGMVFIPHQQIVISESMINTDVKFRGTESWASTANITPSTPNAPVVYAPSQSGTAQGGVTKFIPSLHYMVPFANNRWAFGFSVVSPFGLVTDYGNNSLVNYSGTYTDLKTVDLTPSLAFKVNDMFSIGAGVDVEYLDASLYGMAGLPLGVPGKPAALNTKSINEADGWGYGWHSGILFQPVEGTRLGLAYHSQIHFNLSGTSKFEGPLAAQAPKPGVNGFYGNSTLKADITLPPSTEFSVYQDINSQWSVESSVIYTQWANFNNVLTVDNVAGSGFNPISPALGLVQTSTNVNIPSYFRNTWRVAAGVNFRPSDQWILRVGGGYDESPVKDAYRGVRLPDSDRYALALGAHYQPIKALGVDIGWTHLFIKKANIDIAATTGTQIATTTGKYTNHADIVGAQLTWNIT